MLRTRDDLTRGPVFRGIVSFAVPLLGTSVIQQLYSTVDLLFVGNVLGTSATAAVGVGALLLTCMIGLFSGVSVGVNVRVASCVGAGDGSGVEDVCSMAVCVGLAGGVALVLVGEMLASAFVAAMDVPSESLDMAAVYVRFAVAAALPIAVYNVCAGALRGLGDSRLPLAAQLVGGIANIAANWVALCVAGWGVAGCAFATFVSNSVAAGIALAGLSGRCRGVLWNRRCIDWAFVRFLIVFGLPIGIQTLAITLSNVVVQHQVDLLGVQAVAAFAMYLKVELPIYYPILAMGQAATTFVAQNAGAGNVERVKRGERVCQLACIGVTAVLSVLMLAVGHGAFWLFDRNEAVIGIGLRMISITFPFYVLYAVLEVQADVMRGLGNSVVPALIVLANLCVLRVVLVLAFGTSVESIAATYPITWFSTAVMLVAFRAIPAFRR